MTAEEVLEEERVKWGEWLELLPHDQQCSMMVGVLANRIKDQNLMIQYLRERLARYERKENAQS